MASANIYLTFDGECMEAFDFYKSIFGGEYPYVGTFRDAPPGEGMPVLPDDQLDRIMHISLPLSDGGMLMGSDTGGEWSAKVVKGNNFTISVGCKTQDEVDQIFNGLAKDGNITMPIENTFWNSYFGMVTDKFDIAWMVSCELKQEK